MNITKKAAIRNASVCDAWGLRGPASAIKALSDERDALQAEIEKLRAALKECADDLESEIMNKYGCWVPKYPRERQKRDQDMEPVKKARAALGEKE